MTPQIFDFQVNPADETIRVGPLTVRFLLTGANSNSSIAAFELVVPDGNAYPRRRIATTTMKRRSMGSKEC